MPLKKVLIIFGPTASGKSDKALRISSKLDSIIINADSLQVYKQLKIITSRPTKSDEKKIDHKLYGIMDGKDNCSVASWLTLVKKEIENCWLTNKLPIVVGGTGMYLKALTEGIAEIPTIPNNIKLETEKLKNIHGLDYLYDCLLKSNKKTKINKNDKQRIVRNYSILEFTGRTIEEWQKINKQIFSDVNFEIYVNSKEREVLYKLGERRFEKMVEQGAVDEVKNLLDLRINKENTIMKAIGVREISRYLKNEIKREECFELAKKNTRNYIKRQLTWIRGNNISSNIDLKKYM